MATPVDPAFFYKLGSQAQEYFFQQVLSWPMAVQIVIIVGAILLARHATRTMDAWFERLQARCASMPELCAELPFLVTFKRVITSSGPDFGAVTYRGDEEPLLGQGACRGPLAFGFSLYFSSYRSLARGHAS